MLNIFFISAYAQQPVPVPDWVKNIGGMGDCKVTGIAVDQSDNVIVAGNFLGRITVRVEGITNPVNLNSSGDYDIFIFKYSPDGRLLSAQSFGGNGLDQLNNLDIDKQGNILIACQSNSTQMDCDPGPGVYNPTLVGSWDALVIKLRADGSLHWVRTVGSPATDYGHVVTADQQGNIIFVGGFSGSNVDVGQGWELNRTGDMDGFIIKYNTTGEVQWAYGMGSAQMDEIKSVKTDSNNDIAILGYMAGPVNINPKGPAQILPLNSLTYFLAKYSSSGGIVWANTLEGGNNVSATVTIDKTDAIYVNGVYTGALTLRSQSSGTQTINSTGRNLYLAKYGDGGALDWVRTVGGTSSNPYSYYLATDANADIYIGGFFDRTLVFGNGTNQKSITYHGDRDTFFAKYSPAGDFTWAFNFGSQCSDNFGHKIAVDSKSSVLLGGTFCRTVDFNPTTNCKLELTAVNSRGDGYIAKYNQTKINGEEPSITDLSLIEQFSPAVIDINTKTITITVKPGTDVTKLSPDIKVDFGSIDPSSETSRDFRSPQKYIITTNCNDYEWTVKVISQGIPCPPQSTVANAGLDQIHCETPFISLNANPPAVDETGTWTVVSPSGYVPFNTSNRNDPKAIIHVSPNEEITLRWTITNATCALSSTDEMKIINFTRPDISLPKTVYLNLGETVPINAELKNSPPGFQVRYLWTPATGLDDPTILNPNISSVEDQSYTLEVFYGNNCSATYTIDVAILTPLTIPNVFSPNMDGYNDVWTIKQLDSYPGIEVVVFNRLGSQVFYSRGYPVPWNGTHHGKPLPTGTYFYVIKFKREKTKLSGSITIIR